MIIHNVMEDLVYDEVNKLFDEAEEKKESWLTCSCMQCRVDTMCYVLNRVKPRYIKSGRGLAHFLKFEKTEKVQIMADITSFVIEGMHRVLSTKRPHDHEPIFETENTPVFNFPAITGNILNGSNFRPMEDATISLKMNGELVSQMSILWDNPYTISEKTPGAYTFCPKAIPAKNAGDKEKFIFVLKAEKEGFDPTNFSFDIELTAEDMVKSPLDSSNFYQIKNLFLCEHSEEE